MWFNKVTSDITHLPAFLDYYDQQISTAKLECKIRGNLEKQVADLPGIVEHRFNQLQEIEAVLEHMQIELRRIRRKHFKIFLEGYDKALSSRDAEKYADGEEEVLDQEHIINQIALVRNRYLGIMKGIDAKNFMVGHITRIRAAGLEDISV